MIRYTKVVIDPYSAQDSLGICWAIKNAAGVSFDAGHDCFQPFIMELPWAEADREALIELIEESGLKITGYRY